MLFTKVIKMNRIGFPKLVLIFGMVAGLMSATAFAGEDDIIIIEPDPDGEVVIDDPTTPPPEDPGEPPEEPEDPGEEPEEPPVPPDPEPISAAINFDPNTLNLQSNRQTITLYVELPAGYSVSDIDPETVHIYAVNNEEMEPIYAEDRPVSVGDEDRDHKADLMVKFDWKEVEPEITAGQVRFAVRGVVGEDVEFTGEDTITATNPRGKDKDRWDKRDNRTGKNQPRKEHYNNRCKAIKDKIRNEWQKKKDDHDHNKIVWRQKKQKHDEWYIKKSDWDRRKAEYDRELSVYQQKHNNQTAVSKNYLFALRKHLAANSEIKSALLWFKSSNVNGRQAWHFKKYQTWETITGRYGQLRYSNLRKGSGVEWDVTGRVQSDWALGVSNVLVRIEDAPAGRVPVMVLTYSVPAAAPAVELETAQTQSLHPLGKTFNIPAGSTDAEDVITLSYTDGEVGGVNEKDLSIYFWDKGDNHWKAVPDAVVDPADNSITCGARYGTLYQVMAPKSAAPATDVQPLTAPAASSLGQNYPNPFNPATTINYTISQDCHVTIRLYNAAGERVATVVDEFQAAGNHSVYYDGGASLPRGIYYYQMKAGDFVDTKRMAVLH